MRKLIEFVRFRPFWAIIGLSLLVHLPGINSPLLDYQAYRQCQTASMARNYVRHGMHFLTPELDTEGIPQRAGTEFPIYSFLLALLYKVLGLREPLGRMLSMVFAAWGAIFLYLLVRPRLGEAKALGSALVLSLLPIHVFFTRTVQPEPMALWGFLGFLYYYDQWLNRNRAGRGVRGSGEGTLNKENLLPHSASRIPHWLFAVLLGTLAPLLKLPFLYLLVPLWAYLAWERFGVAALKRLSVLTIFAAILTLTWTWYHYAKTAPVSVLPLSSGEHWANLKPILTLKLWENHFISRIPELCLTYSGLLFAAAGAIWLRKNRTLRFWGVWFGATALYILLLGAYGQIHRYTELPFAPICAVFIAAGIVSLWERHAERPGWRVALLIGVLGIPLHAGLRIAHWYRWEYPWVFQARADVEKVSKAEDLWITHTREVPVLLYHINRYGFSPDLRTSGLAAVETYRRQGARFLLTPIDVSWTEHPEFVAYFDKNAHLIVRSPDYLIYRLD